MREQHQHKMRKKHTRMKTIMVQVNGPGTLNPIGKVKDMELELEKYAKLFMI